MKIKKTIAAAIIALTLMVSQSGCVLGIFFWPLWIVGSVVGITGFAVTLGGIAAPVLIGPGVGLMLVGIVLDEKNPGHVDMLNNLPRDKDLAKEIGVSVDDLSDYNDHLNQIRE